MEQFTDKETFMKTIKNLMVAAMVLFTGNAMAQKLSADAIEIEAGGEADLVVSFTSEQNLTAAQFTIVLPEGISIKKNGKRYVAALGEDIEDDYEWKIKNGDTGQIVLITRVDNTSPALTSGVDLITLTLVTEETATLGDKQATISGITFSQNGTSVAGNADFNVTITVFVKNETVISVSGGATSTFGQALAEPSVTVTQGYDGVLSYKSSNGNIVKVATDGKLTAIGAGTATITISGTETAHWKAPAPVTYNVQIDKASITPAVTISGWTYGEAANTPAVTGNTGNGTVTYQYKVKDANDNTYSETVPTDANNYTVKAIVEATANYKGGETTADFTIARKSVTTTMIQAIADQVYNGNALTPAITVKDGNSTLALNTDYTVTYTNNTNAGTATVTITGQGNYKDTASKTFTISAKTLTKDMVDDIENQVFNGSALQPKPVVKDGNKTLAEGTDYTVTYTNNTNPGTATITITGKGNYQGTVTTQFVIKVEGDANDDDKVDVSDIDTVIEYVDETVTVVNKAADVNNDGFINVADIDYIIERIN